MKVKKCISTIILVSIFIFSFASVSLALELVAVSASPGGSWFAVMGGICEILQKNDKSMQFRAIPGSGVANPISVGSNKAQLGFAFPPNIAESLTAVGAYEGKEAVPGLRTIVGGFGSSPLHFAMRKDFADKHGIRSLKDIADKKIAVRICTDIAGTTDEYWGRKLLEFYGITYDNVKKWGGKVILGGYSDHVQLIKDGHADMAINNINIPAGPFVEMMLSVPMVILPFDDKGIEFMTNKMHHTPFTIPAGTYKGQDKDVLVATVLTSLITNDKVSEEIVYKITKILDEQKEEIRKLAPATAKFDPKNGIKNLGAPLHPGAEKYYKEVGYLK